MLGEIENVLSHGLQDNVTPGLAAAAGSLTNSDIYFSFSAGYEFRHIYDLASLTKVLCTTVLIAKAVVDNKIELDETPWPQWPGASVRHVLHHRSGLPAWLPLYQFGADWSNIVKLAYAPGEKTVYSDLGFIALGNLLELRYSASLESLFAEFRNEHYQGSQLAFLKNTNDKNCVFLGGATGHAGLFGSISDVEIAVRYLGACIVRGGSDVEKQIQQFAKEPGERPLGFDRASKDGASAGCLSSESVGHLGFTGTSFFIDPLAHSGQGLFYILLTNRLAIADDKPAITNLRQKFHIAAQRWLNFPRPLRERD